MCATRQNCAWLDKDTTSQCQTDNISHPSPTQLSSIGSVSLSLYTHPASRSHVALVPQEPAEGHGTADVRGEDVRPRQRGAQDHLGPAAEPRPAAGAAARPAPHHRADGDRPQALHGAAQGLSSSTRSNFYIYI